MEDISVIDAFVAYLRKHGCPGLQVDERPEDTNRSSPEIDAIAGSLAIEHTSIDTLPDQRGESAQFMKVVDGIERELVISFRLRISIEYTAVKKGQDWNAIRQKLKNWISTQSPRLSDGSNVKDVPGIPFRLHISKDSNRPPSILFYRFIQPAGTLPTRIKTQFDRKAKKLLNYKPDKTTVLLVESDDIALMSESLIQSAILDVYPKGPPSGVAQIWYVDTSIPALIEFSRIVPW